jgi:hypothetical protein
MVELEINEAVPANVLNAVLIYGVRLMAGAHF